jgi:thiamine biosynthesis lipoprotein
MRGNRRSFLNFVRQSTPAAAECWLHVNRTAMACKFEVTLPMSEEAGVAIAADALDEIDRLESQLTVFRDDSEVSLINQRAAFEPVVVEEALFDLLIKSQLLHRETEGAFDITSGPLTRCWGFLKREGRIPSAIEVVRARTNVGSDKFLLDAATRTIRYTQEGVEINLGSIGKGFALDQIAVSLRSQMRSALLNAGASSMLAIGDGARGEGWIVGLRHPRSKLKRLGVLHLTDCALATSGSEEQFFEHGGRRYGHIIDPRTGWPAKSVTSVSVVTDSAAFSDALATAFYVGGRELAERYCASHPEVMAVMLESSAAASIVIGSHRGCEGPFAF